jgi:transposase
MERAVLRGQAAKGMATPRQIGIDEKAISKGHHYMILVCDLEAVTVEYIGEERTEASLSTYFAAFTPEELQQIEAISLDMWPAYIKACKSYVPQAEKKMVVDRFHIMQHVGNDVNAVRKE